jgi:hypothetical protein
MGVAVTLITIGVDVGVAVAGVGVSVGAVVGDIGVSIGVLSEPLLKNTVRPVVLYSGSHLG